MIALAKAQPGKLNYASAGRGSGIHLGTVLFALTAGIELTFSAAADLSAGLRVKADQAVLDATVVGLTHDNRAIAAMLLDELAHGSAHE